MCSYLFGTVESLPSAEASRITGSGGSNSITWNCPSYAGVTTYKFYIGTGTGGENYYFTSSSSSYLQIGVPSTGTPGIPLTGSTYTVVWPTNLINAPVMATGIGATTGMVAIYDGTNWITVGTSGTGSGSSSVVGNLAGTRVFGTVYQNTTGLPILVSGNGVITGGSGDSQISCLIGSTSTPASVVWASVTTGTISSEPVGFICRVPSLWYYKVSVTNIIGPTSTSGSNWYESQLP
jgi:hypothetical protein